MILKYKIYLNKRMKLKIFKINRKKKTQLDKIKNNNYSLIYFIKIRTYA
jgi:hypothetical protein